jgi:hypothetical protein
MCGLVTHGLGVWRVLGELLEIVGASTSSWCTRFETHRSEDGERVLLSTWVLVTRGGTILLVSAPTWIRGKRQLLDTMGKKSDCLVCALSLLLALNFSIYILHLSFLALVLLVCLYCSISWLGCFPLASVIFAREKKFWLSRVCPLYFLHLISAFTFHT